MKIFFTSFTILSTLLFTTFYTYAGDFAKRHIHGFSPDGELFAFEEYGVQDGSGFPYSNIYVIDTNTDQWTANSPYRIRLEDETKTVFDAREEARILAGPVMKSFEDRGNMVATNRSTELGIDKNRFVANPRAVVPPIDATVEFRLEDISFAASSTCEAFGPSKGFKLLQIATQPEEVTREFHKDTSVPESRNCPLDYELADLVTYFPDNGQASLPENGQPRFAVLILMKTVGFEGPDGRYLAVTGKLE